MKRLFYLASLLAIAAGCNKVESPAPELAKTFKLNSEIAQTKVAVDDHGLMTWQKNDEISLLSESNPFTISLTSGEGTSTGIFSGSIEGTPYAAVYPAGDHSARVDGYTIVDLPDSYQYTAAVTNAPMLAEVISDEELSNGTAVFHHIGALVRVSYKNVPAEAKTFTLTSDVNIAGQFPTNYKDEEPIISVNNNIVPAGKSVTINFEEVQNEMTFYVPLPCGEYGFSVALNDADGNPIEGSSKSVTSVKVDRKAFFKTQMIVLKGEDIVYFKETFDGNNGTGGNDGRWSGSIATNSIKFDMSDWTVANASGANKCAKFGTGSGLGTATTPAISIDAESAKLTFKAAAWDGNSESTTLKLSATGATISNATVTLAKGEWTEYVVDLTNINGAINIRFEGNKASNSRFFLDNVAVYNGDAPSFEVEEEPTEPTDPSVLTVTMAAGTNGSECTVNDKKGIKVGTSKAGGNMTITVPKGATVLHLYAAAWNGVTELSLNITPADKVDKDSIDLTSDSGIAGSSTAYELEGDENDFKFTINLSGIDEETTFTLTSSAKRFVVWGCSAE